MSETKIVVLDDDPTGSQTVHGCLLLTRWDIDTLKTALQDDSPLFFVLTNTRGMDAQQAATITREVCQNLHAALIELKAVGQIINPIMVSRSDSTLRGHYPVETDVIAEEMGPFDAHFLIPAFFEGGRFTHDGTHYLIVDEHPVPVHETEFARDSVFGFKHSYMPDYVEEKTAGTIRAGDVRHFSLDEVRGDCIAQLMELEENQCCVVDCVIQSDLDSFADQIRQAAANGKRFLFRSAASLLTSLAQLPPQPVVAEEMRAYVRGGRPGAVIVGSHVKKTTSQLKELLQQPDISAIEIDVTRIERDRDTLLASVLDAASVAHDAGQTPIIYTSRVEVSFPDQHSRLRFGEAVSAFLMDIVRGLPKDIGFLISKGGITSNDVLSQGLALRTSRVVGQILAGCSVVRCPQDHSRYPNLPVVIFPGNVGDEFALAAVYQRLSGRQDEKLAHVGQAASA